MGRKIPGKKHRGIKNPVKQQLERKEKLKLLINCPPTDPDFQEIPKSVLEINRLRELVKNGKLNKKNKIKANKERGASYSILGNNRNEKSWPSLKRKSDESDRSYLWRINKETNDIISEVKIEVKHDVEVERDRSGNVSHIKKYKTSETSSKLLKNKKNLKRETDYLLDRKERMKLRRKLKLKMKKVGKNRTSEYAVEKKEDLILFGEVVHEPPQFNKRPKGCNVEKPGSKQLLLNSLFSTEHRSMSEVKQLTEEREKVLKAYEVMKLKNRSLFRNKNK